MPEYRRKKQYSGIKKPRNKNVPRYWQRWKDSNPYKQSQRFFFEKRPVLEGFKDLYLTKYLYE